MVAGKMIGYGTYLRNMISITAFVFMPDRLKTFLYKKVLINSRQSVFTTDILCIFCLNYR